MMLRDSGLLFGGYLVRSSVKLQPDVPSDDNLTRTIRQHFVESNTTNHSASLCRVVWSFLWFD